MKILITYAYAGVGHKKAALAIEKALAGHSGVEVKNVDVLDYTNAFFKASYPNVYLFLINRLPTFWGLFYYLLDFKAVDFFMAPVRRFIHRLNCKGFIEFIKAENPDVVVSTHFLPSEIVSGLKKSGEYKGKLINVVTDFIAHSFWMASGSDYFIGAIQKTKADLLRRGVPEEKIRIMGIPCDPVFSISKGKEALMKQLGIEPGFFNVLMMSGGFGTGPMKEIVAEINNLDPDTRDKMQLIAICGKNELLFHELAKMAQGLRVRLKAFGYMNNVDEFMEVSDIIVTKPGGLTISEALSKTLPMIIVQPILGQETRNCKILTGYGTAVKAKNIQEVCGYIEEFVTSPEKMISTRTRIKLLRYPDAAKNIANFVEEIASSLRSSQ
ncbi:MAG: glycosyltransferase [Candidatus Omnitrophota bacterium]|nr:glycosyltransferase [Candidatus Omnitrophota bacterium]